MASRSVRFDVNKLSKIAANVVGASSCVNVEITADGMHNKALLLTTSNGKQVVAKIPFPAAGQPRLTTASEVATMDYMRNCLNIPVPRVYSWCSNAKETPVEAEYILMEKASGVPLQSIWAKMDLAARFSVAKEISRFQALWSDDLFKGYGSIYYTADLSDRHHLPVRFLNKHSAFDKKFVLGPSTGRDWNDDERQSLKFERGPWQSLDDYLRAVGSREMTCVKKLPRLPPPQVTLCGPGTYQTSREKKVRALEYYLQIFEHLAPSDTAIRKPSIWHADLHAENIFVDPSQPTKITCLIDWQSTEVAPLFVQARQPYILDYDGAQWAGLDRPQLPDNYKELTQEEKDVAGRLLLSQSLCVGWRLWTQRKNSDIWKSLDFQETPAFELLLLARSLLVDGEALYSARVAEHLKTNNGILASSGLTIPDSTMAELELDGKGAARGIEAMSSIQQTLGDLFPERGCVRREQYYETKDALSQCKEQIINIFAKTEADRAAWNESWPFDD